MKNDDIVTVFDTWLSAQLDNVHTCLPGEIVQYLGHSERKAKVQPLVKLKSTRGKILKIQPIENVPVIFPGSKKFRQTWPLEKGDGVLLMFSEASIGNFLQGAGEQEADSSVRFSLTDCIAIPGLWSFKNVPTAPENDTDYFLEFENAKIQITANTNFVKIEDGNSNIIETSLLSVSINNNLEVLQ